MNSVVTVQSLILVFSAGCEVPACIAATGTVVGVSISQSSTSSDQALSPRSAFGSRADVAVGVQRVEAGLVPVLGLSQRCAAAALLGGARLCGYGYRELRPAREPLTRGVRMDRKKLFLQAQRREE